MPVRPIDRPSPNSGPRARGVDMVVLHYTGMKTARAALERLCDPQAEVSAHYLVEEDGRVWRLVDENRRAWHAGKACWAGDRDINDRSIGIELVNPGHEFGYRPFPEPQMAVLEELLAEIAARHRISPARIVGHSDVAPTRKSDPGELFDWRRLARHGLALRPEASGGAPMASEAPALLEAIGYDRDAPLQDVVRAFQRRFAQDSVTGSLDSRTLETIAAAAAASIRQRKQAWRRSTGGSSHRPVGERPCRPGTLTDRRS